MDDGWFAGGGGAFQGGADVAGFVDVFAVAAHGFGYFVVADGGVVVMEPGGFTAEDASLR